jgi:ATP synthase protein I
LDNNHVKVMLKKVATIDFFLGVSIAIILCFTYREFTVAFSMGLIAALINFIISGIITDIELSKNAFSGIFFMLVKLLRIFLICAMPLFFYNFNTNAIIAYILGYNSHFISLILYSSLGKNLR